MTRNRTAFRLPRGWERMMKAFLLLGGATLGLGLLMAPERAWANLLLVSYFLVGIGLAGIVFVALQYVCGAGWSVALRRVPEAMAAALPLGAGGIALVLIAKPSLYPWVHEAGDLVGFKRAWLNLPFFLARSGVYLAVWFAFSYLMVRHSRLQDLDGDLVHTRKNVRLSAAFLVIFGLTFWLASFDWIMSLEPHWYSTIFAVYSFAGLFVAGLAAIIILVIVLERLGPLVGVLHEEHLHDLGKLLFAFSTFWMYIWFSQYMLIWYANIPEETSYFVRRLQGYWTPLFLLNIFLNWVVPFLVLLPRGTKRSSTSLLQVASIVLVGRWLDLYLMIAPQFTGTHQPAIGAWEVAAMMLATGAFLLFFFRAFSRAAAVPIRDPYLIESLQFHEG